MNITVHTTWPLHMDYPIWRMQIQKYKPYIYQGLVSLSDNHEGVDYTTCIKGLLGNLSIPCFDPLQRQGDEDWRDKSVKAAYNNFNGDWIWFTEEDFFIKDKTFFEKIEEGMKTYDAIAYSEQGRIHPACLFVKKLVADRTERNFAANPGVYDHFYRFTHDLIGRGLVGTLEDVGLKEFRDYFHMTGLTHNYHRFKMGLLPTKVEDFVMYNHYAAMVCPDIPEFLETIHKVNRDLKQYYDKNHFLIPIFESILE